MLSASGAYRWMACGPSARLESILPEPKRKQGSFNHSLNGTTAHQMGEAKLKRHFGQITAAEYNKEINEVKATEFYDSEFEKYVDDYVLYVRSQVGEGDTPYFEQRVDFSEWVPEGYGTADVVIINDTTVRIIDLKFGVGIKVDAEENPQLRLYALAACSKKYETIQSRKTVATRTASVSFHSSYFSKFIEARMQVKVSSSEL